LLNASPVVLVSRKQSAAVAAQAISVFVIAGTLRARPDGASAPDYRNRESDFVSRSALLDLA
jgi:hypothetical protein